MPILAIDTTTAWCSVAIYFPDGKYYCRHEKIAHAASQVVLDWIAQLMQDSQVQWQDLTAIAVSQGPGAFTGVRLGIGIAQGMAYARNIPLIPIPSLEGMLAHAVFFGPEKFPVQQGFQVLIDARMQQFYSGTYHLNTPHTLSADAAIAMIQIQDLPADPSRRYYFYDLEQSSELVQDIPFTVHAGTPHALGIAYLASLKTDLSVFKVQDCQPLYVRNQVALTIAQRQKLRQ